MQKGGFSSDDQLQCQHDMHIGAGRYGYAPAIVSMIALIFRAFGSSMQSFFQNFYDAMRSLMWHKDQKSVCALVLAIVNEPRQHDRFVLIGLCWLYGRSEYPPPPVAPDTRLEWTSIAARALANSKQLTHGTGESFLSWLRGVYLRAKVRRDK